MYNPPLHSTLITNMAPDGGFMRVFEEFRIPNREFINIIKCVLLNIT